MNGTLERRSVAFLAALTICGLVLRVWCAMAHPPTVDDLMVAISAVNYVESGQLGPTMWNHPALRNLVAYGMLHLFGSGMVGILGVNLLMGTLCIPLIHALARRLTGDSRVALTAALLWTVEPLAIEYSAQAINDVYLAFFPLAALWALYRYLDSRHPGWLLLCGALFGLGLASKWSALFQLAVAGGLILWRVAQCREARGERLAHLFFIGCALVILPLALYLASFAPWFGRGYALSEWPALQKSMYVETKLHTGYHEAIYGDHLASEWFVRPGVTHVDPVFTIPDGPLAEEPSLRHNLVLLIALANPLVWLAVLPALAVTAWSAWRTRSEGLAVLTALLLFSYLPFAVVPRPVWFNTGMVVLPYVVIVVAYGVWHLAPGQGARWRAGYVALAVLVSLALFPLAAGKGFEIPRVGDYLLVKFKDRQGVSKDVYERGGP